MPLATDAEVAEFERDYGPIRLACDTCDREDFDGVRLLPAYWEDIGEEQSLRAALSAYEGGDDPAPRGYSVLDWWTHMGTCPDCCVDSPKVVEVLR